jgi:hypothetical protein
MQPKPAIQPIWQANRKPAPPAKRRLLLATAEFCQFFGGGFQPGDLVESLTLTVPHANPKVTQVKLIWRKVSDIPTGRA